MRIVLIGQQAFGKAVLEAILDAGKDDVAGVFCSPDREGQPDDPLKAGALERNIPVFQPDRFRSADAVAQFTGLTPDLCVMAYVTDIV
ncbi:MAG: methionyl-tRNA formyltransferase, partial [Chloroflexi bacterium]|nr:methionyl-tRNA formyltransferase [Chloroflexota bacterium]